LFPVRLRDLPCDLMLHNVPPERFEVGGFEVEAELVCHPGSTVGYRISEGNRSLAYLPDHEPALGVRAFPAKPEWTSGFDLAADADLLIHDAQYTTEEYQQRIGWGHSAMRDALAFATLSGARRFVSFHHDPTHDDVMLDRIDAAARAAGDVSFALIAGTEGATFEV
jgi:phosphoribosyl 1,2-cyclic phosphodiesterase